MRIGRLLLFLLAGAGSLMAGDWPTWRGPNQDGVADGSPPLEWSESKNLIWKSEEAGQGNSSPIVCGDRLFVTGADEKGRTRSLMCFDRDKGGLHWRKTVEFEGREPTHKTNLYCAASPVTDGKTVFVSHGSAGMYAYDFEGKQLWKRDLGEMTHVWGNASSPILHKDSVILLCGPGLKMKLAALAKSSGEVVWETPLPEAESETVKQYKGSWTTPRILENGERTELIVPLPKWVVSFDPQSGKELWRCGGLSDLFYTNVLIGKDAMVAMCGFRGPAIGLRIPDAKKTGDITKTHRLWRVEKNQQRIGSGVILGDHVFIMNETGVVQCIELKTGKELWSERAGRANWGSMNLVGGRIHVTDQSGTTHIMKPSVNGFERLAENRLGSRQTTRASAAFSGDRVFLRTYEALYCFGEE